MSNRSFNELKGFTKEATTLKRMHHPAVLRYISHSENKGFFVLVTEYVEGMTLNEVVNRKGPRLSEPEIADIARQLLQAVIQTTLFNPASTQFERRNAVKR